MNQRHNGLETNMLERTCEAVTVELPWFLAHLDEMDALEARFYPAQCGAIFEVFTGDE